MLTSLIVWVIFSLLRMIQIQIVFLLDESWLTTLRSRISFIHLTNVIGLDRIHICFFNSVFKIGEIFFEFFIFMILILLWSHSSTYGWTRNLRLISFTFEYLVVEVKIKVRISISFTIIFAFKFVTSNYLDIFFLFNCSWDLIIRICSWWLFILIIIAC